MKKIKNLIIFVIISIIVISTTLLIILLNSKQDLQQESNINRIVSTVRNRNEYFAIKNVIDKYFSNLTMLNEEKYEIHQYMPVNGKYMDQNEIEEHIHESVLAYKNMIYNYLDEDYKKDNGINLNNINEKLGDYQDVQTFIDNMYYVDIRENLKAYFVYGEVVEKSDLQKKSYSIMIIVNSSNKAFKLIPNIINYNVELGKELIIDFDDISYNNYNKIKYSTINNETYCRELFNDYRNRLIYNVESVYYLFNENYRNEKFGDLKEFVEFVKLNKKALTNVSLKSYNVQSRNMESIFICVDRSGKQYYFSVTSPMKYTVSYDIYSTDTQETIEEYNKLSEVEKVIFNLNKINFALNAADYKYIYNRLSNNYKENNFKTLESFEEYAKIEFFANNQFEYLKYENVGQEYIAYNVDISDATGNDLNIINKTFIMRLRRRNRF